MREAVIVSTARTPIGKAYRGAFNNLEAPTLAAHAIREAVRRARIEPGEVEEVVMGAAAQQGTQGYNVARQCAIAAGLPVTTSGMTVDRQCSSGLMAIATAAKQVIHDGMPIVVAGGLETAKFKDEIVPVTCTKSITNKDTAEVTYEEVTLAKDEGNRSDTTLE